MYRRTVRRTDSTILLGPTRESEHALKSRESFGQEFVLKSRNFVHLSVNISGSFICLAAAGQPRLSFDMMLPLYKNAAGTVHSIRLFCLYTRRKDLSTRKRTSSQFLLDK
jgi:hypothetical protein